MNITEEIFEIRRLEVRDSKWHFDNSSSDINAWLGDDKVGGLVVGRTATTDNASDLVGT